ncbi:MAG TPA: LamG-like jellyroll fold domain-containing protein [Verrucomicrobiae bacterium]
MLSRYCLVSALALAASMPTAKADYASTVTSLNPIAYYRLNETTPVPPADIATNSGTFGASATGYYFNSPTHPAPGALAGSTDTAAAFSAAAKNAMLVPWSSTLNPRPPFSIEGWFYPASSPNGNPATTPLASLTVANGRCGWILYTVGDGTGTTGGWNFRTGDSTGYRLNFTGATPIAAGNWYHVVVTYDGTNAVMYVNARQDATAANSIYTPNTDTALGIGARGDKNFWYDGTVDEVAIYTNVLSAAEVQAHYENGTNSASGEAYAPLVLAKNPLLYYRLGEPAYVPPPGLVTAVNLGSLGPAADGIYNPGAQDNVSGAPYSGMGAGNTACAFNSIIGDVQIPGPSVQTDQFTMTCWFKRTGAHQNGQAMIFSRPTDPTSVGFGFGYNAPGPGVDQLNVHWNEGPSSWLTGLVPPNDIWCFGAAVITPTNVTVYLNNSSATTAWNFGANAVHDFSAAPLFIGKDPVGGGYPPFNGSIDEVALFDRALTAAEIQTLFNSSQMAPQITGLTRTPADPLFEGYNITMTASVAGIPPFAYQWYKNGSSLSGKTSTTLNIASAATTDSGNYTFVVTNAYGAATSAVQVLAVSASPPTVLAQTTPDVTRAIGGWVTYSVTAGGSSPISYQWNHGASAIAGATTSVLRLTNLQLADAGAYNVTLTNPYGTANSTSGTVTVFAVTNYPFAALYGNPLAYFRLNEASGTTAFDYAGGLNGTLNGPVVMGASGPQPPTWVGFESTNTAFTFNGSSTSVRLPSLNLATNQMTIVAWINPAGPQSDQTGIFNTRSSTGTAGFFLNYNNNNALSYVWEGTGSWAEFQSGLVPVIGQWNFVALVIDPVKGTAYLDDGTGLKSAVYSPKEGNKTVIWDAPFIGVDSGYNRFFNGSIDEVAVYNRALSPAEIANLDLLGFEGPVAPRITQQPGSVTGYAGQPAEFSVGALGALPLSYEWHHAGTNVPGGNRAALTLASPWFTDAGDYDVRVSNSIGSSNSQSATLTVLAAPMFSNLTNELVLHLKFDGTYADSSGRANDAFPIGSPAFVPGRLGQALHYNTDNSGPSTIANYATLLSPADLQFGTTQNFSVSYWIRFFGPSVDLPVLCNNDCGEGCVGFFFGPAFYVPGAWAWSFANATYAGIDADGATNSINDGNWHSVVNTFDRAGLGNTYLDGILVDSRPISGFTDSLDSANAVNIGQVGTGNYYVVFGADVDDLGVWRRALSPAEAESIYLVGQNYGTSFDTYGPVVLSIRKSGAALELVWQTGTLLEADKPDGTWTSVPNATAPYYRVTPGPGAKFYKVQLSPAS